MLRERDLGRCLGRCLEGSEIMRNEFLDRGLDTAAKPTCSTGPCRHRTYFSAAMLCASGFALH